MIFPLIGLVAAALLIFRKKSKEAAAATPDVPTTGPVRSAPVRPTKPAGPAMQPRSMRPPTRPTRTPYPVRVPIEGMDVGFGKQWEHTGYTPPSFPR